MNKRDKIVLGKVIDEAAVIARILIDVTKLDICN